MKNNWWKQSWFEYSILVVIFSVAAMLRFYKLGDWSYWVDELYTLEASKQPYIQNMFVPFWIVTDTFLDVFGISAFSLRLFPCIVGILTILLLYFPIKSIFNRSVALLTIALLAISPWHIYLSQLARWYSLLLLVSSFSLISFYFFIERSSLKYLIISVFLFAFALTLHLTAVFVLMIGITYLVLLSCLPNLLPQQFSTKKTNIFLLVLVLVALMFIPKFIGFVKQWQEIQETMGYWGSTPINFSLKVIYHSTPSIAFIALAGLVLLLTQKERKGLFLTLYCMLPILCLNVAAIFKINVSSKYVFFVLPGLLMATSYFCRYVIDNVRYKKGLVGLALIGIIVMPAMRTNFKYFSTDYGNRNRLEEAVNYVKSRYNPDDQIFLLYFFETSEEGKFYFDSIARLNDFKVESENYIFPSQPTEIDAGRKIWVLTIGKNISSNSTGFYKWITKETSLVTEFKATRGLEDNSVRVYLHRPS